VEVAIDLHLIFLLPALAIVGDDQANNLGLLVQCCIDFLGVNLVDWYDGSAISGSLALGTKFLL
jgi:hypothetical protein